MTVIVYTKDNTGDYPMTDTHTFCNVTELKDCKSELVLKTKTETTKFNRKAIQDLEVLYNV